MPDTPAEPTKCEITGCDTPANGHYRWGDVPQQQGDLCQSCAGKLWDMCSPDVRDRMVISPFKEAGEVAHA